ncbi:hypothetical protein [Adonisia turfae]
MTRPGLTLLEVVLAIALLALAAGGVASAISAIAQPTDVVAPDPTALSATVAEVLRDPGRYEFDARVVAAEGRDLLRVDGVAIDVTLQARSGRGAWMAFALDGGKIVRWVRVPEAR